MLRTVWRVATTVMVSAVGLVLLGPWSAVASPTAGPPRASSPEYGMSVFLYGNPDTTGRDLGKLQALGFRWQKSLFRWRDSEGAGKGRLDWTESDRVVSASAAAGLKIIGRLDFQPDWARGDR